MSLLSQNQQYKSHLNVSAKACDAPKSTLGGGAPRVILSQIESAVAFLPVLAMQESASLKTDSDPSTPSRVVKRSDLAARVGVDPARPIGEQLRERGQMSDSEAQLVDGGYFQDRALVIDLRFAGHADDVAATLNELKGRKLIDSIDCQKEEKDFVFAQVHTRKFLDLAALLAAKDSVALLTINDSILLV
ncbi:MAG TPA: hypothetical protein V6C81_27420 [Planktothrix sp.]|jgi:hypothetical protein